MTARQNQYFLVLFWFCLIRYSTRTFFYCKAGRGVQRINNIAVMHLLEHQCCLSRIPCASVAKATHIYPVKDMKVLFTENHDKDARIVNGQEATNISAQNNTIIFHPPEGQRVFVYPITHILDDRPVAQYPFTPACAQTKTKSQGRNIRHLIVWLDSKLVPAGTAHVGLSRVRQPGNILLCVLMLHTFLMFISCSSRVHLMFDSCSAYARNHSLVWHAQTFQFLPKTACVG